MNNREFRYWKVGTTSLVTTAFLIYIADIWTSDPRWEQTAVAFLMFASIIFLLGAAISLFRSAKESLDKDRD